MNIILKNNRIFTVSPASDDNTQLKCTLDIGIAPNINTHNICEMKRITKMKLWLFSDESTYVKRTFYINLEFFIVKLINSTFLP